MAEQAEKIAGILATLAGDSAMTEVLMPIHVHDDALPADLLERLRKHVCYEVGFTFGEWKSNQDIDLPHWNRYYAGGKRTHRDSVSHLLKGVVAEAVEFIVKNHLPEGAVPIRVYANAHTYGVDGFTHIDSDHEGDYTVVLYLIEKWDHDWAGETVYFDDDDDIIRAVTPRPNRIVLFPGNIRHAGRGVTRLCNRARTVFVIKAKTDD